MLNQNPIRTSLLALLILTAPIQLLAQEQTGPQRHAQEELARLEKLFNEEISQGKIATNVPRLLFFRGVVRRDSPSLEVFFELAGEVPFPDELKKFVSPESAILLAEAQKISRLKKRTRLALTGFDASCTTWLDGKISGFSSSISSGNSHIAQVHCNQNIHSIEFTVPTASSEFTLHRSQFVVVASFVKEKSQNEIIKTTIETETKRPETSVMTIRAGAITQQLFSLRKDDPLATFSSLLPGGRLELCDDTNLQINAAAGLAQPGHTSALSRSVRYRNHLWLRGEVGRGWWSSQDRTITSQLLTGLLTLSSTTGLQGVYPILGINSAWNLGFTSSQWKTALTVSVEALPTVNDSYVGLSFSITLYRSPQ